MPGNSPMVTIELSPQYRVRASARVNIPLTASAVWGQMRDFAWFTTLDPFHARMRVMSPELRPGARIVIEHRFLGIGFNRVGRVLQWNEGSGYGFSDLSKRGVRVGFPHIYQYEARPLGNCRSCIQVTVRGRWTSKWLPRVLVSAWLRFVMAHLAARIRIAMLDHALRLPAKDLRAVHLRRGKSRVTMLAPFAVNNTLLAATRTDHTCRPIPNRHERQHRCRAQE